MVTPCQRSPRCPPCAACSACRRRHWRAWPRGLRRPPPPAGPSVMALPGSAEFPGVSARRSPVPPVCGGADRLRQSVAGRDPRVSWAAPSWGPRWCRGGRADRRGDGNGPEGDGAGSGLLFGSAAGAGNAYASAAGVQARYDIGYAQCMVAHGNTVQPIPTTYAGYPSYPYGYPYPAYRLSLSRLRRLCRGTHRRDRRRVGLGRRLRDIGLGWRVARRLGRLAWWRLAPLIGCEKIDPTRQQRRMRWVRRYGSFIRYSRPKSQGGVDSASRSIRRPWRRSTRRWVRYAVLVFRGQALTQGEQVAMARQFGTLDLGLKKLKKQAERMEHDEIIDISNVDLDGAIADPRESSQGREQPRQPALAQRQLLPAPGAPHTRCFRPWCVPRWGGDTEFADLRAAYDALPEEMKAGFAGLTRSTSRFTRASCWATRATPSAAEAIDAAGALAAGAHPSRLRPQAALRRRARAPHRRHGRWRKAGCCCPICSSTRRSASSSTALLAGRRPGDVGQPLHPASRRRFDLSERRELRRTTTEDRPAAFESAA